MLSIIGTLNPSSSMAPHPFHTLNTDVLLEVFSHYVAMQENGIFILMLVSKKWESLALKTPSLWEWIFINTQDPECAEKAFVHLSLLRDCSPKITLHLPVTDWNPDVATLLDRCQSCYFRIPDYLGFDDLDEDMVEIFCALGSAQVRRIQCPWTHIKLVRTGKAIEERIYDVELLLTKDDTGTDHQYQCTYRMNESPAATGDWKPTASEAKYSAAKKLVDVFKLRSSEVCRNVDTRDRPIYGA